MPPKPSKSPLPQATQGPSKAEFEAIQAYLAQKPDFQKVLAEARQISKEGKLDQREQSEYDRLLRDAVHLDLLQNCSDFSGRQWLEKEVAMPVLPKEENTARDLPEQIAKESADTAKNGSQKAKATVDDHKANPGPVLAENLGEQPVASKQELKKRAEELNK